MRKTLLLCLLILSLAACAPQSTVGGAAQDCSLNREVKMNASEVGAKGKKDAAAALVEEYLKSFQAAGTPDSCRVDAYRVEKVTPAKATFAVKPSARPTVWEQGSAPAADGWLSLTLSIKVVEKDGVYTLSLSQKGKDKE